MPLQDEQPQLLQPIGLDAQGRGVDISTQGGPVPQVERVAEAHDRLGQCAAPQRLVAFIGELLEPVRVHHAGLQVQRVRRAERRELGVAAQHMPQSGHV